jgi:tetratricopeptide (TPR) repeat protein
VRDQETPPAGSKASDPSGPPIAPTQTSVDLTARLAPETLLAGRYRIHELVGVGGMGVVYRAVDETLGVEIAIKVLRPDLGADPRITDRFRSELVLARQVTHRNVVRIHDLGAHEDLRFLTMRFVKGRSLREILERDRRLPLEHATRIVRQVAEGLAQAHEAGVIHRDLKPGNILIDGEQNAYITDFGVARSLTQDGMTRDGAIVGTPDYLSPEQIAGEPLDGRTDLYALGIVFFEMLSGELPFRPGSTAEMLAQRLSGRPRELSQIGVQVPSRIRALIRRCLERNPSRRYPNAAALIADLERGGAAPRRLGKGRIAASLLAILLVGTAVWVFGRRSTSPGGAPSPRSRSAPAAGHAIAVLPLRDETSDPGLSWTAAGIPELLTTSLSENPELRVLDSQRVMRSLRDLRLAEGPYEQRVMRQLAELWNVDRLVTGTVRRAGQRIRVDLSLNSVGGSASAADRRFFGESDGPEGIFRVVGELGQRLGRELGLDRSAAREPSVLETRSVEAARAYAEGRSRLLMGDDVGAAPALEHAVASDPGFAAALEALSQTYQSLGRQDKAVRAAERAVSAAGTSGSRLAYRSRARLALVRGSPAEAEKNYRQIVQRYPHDVEPRLDLAAAQAAQGHHSEAMGTLKEAVAIDPNDPRAWFLLGKSANLTGEPARAVGDYLVRALTLQTRLGNQKGRADVLNAIGVGHQQLGDFPKAMENYTAALELRRRLGDDRGTAATLRNRALVSNAMGHPAEAETDLKAARELFERIGDRNGQSDVQNDFGFVREGRGDYPRALEAYQQALKIRRDLGDERLLAQSYDNVGYIYFLLGEYDNALVYWQQALDRRRRIGEKDGIVLSVQNMGFLEVAQGKWDAALKSFAEALEQSREIDFKNGVAISLGNLGILHRYQGRYKAALGSLGEALAVSRQADFKPALAEFTLAEAGTLLEIGSRDAAGARLETAEPWIRATDNREQAADLEVLRGEWHLQRGEKEAARRSLAHAMDLAKQSKSKVALLRTRIALASIQRERGEPAAAAAGLETALREAESLGHALLIIQAAEGLSRAELSRGRPRQAKQSVQRALDLAERVGWSAGLYRLEALLGRILDTQKDAGAADAWARSAREIEQLRGEIDPSLREAFDSLGVVREVAARQSRRSAA